MAMRGKGFKAKQSRRMSRRMDESQVGSHIQRGAHSRRVENASSVSFSSQRASAKASGSQVRTVAPRSTSRESDAAFRQRTQQRGYIEGVRHRSRVRSLVTFLLAAVVVVAVAAGAGFLAFRGSIGSEMSLKNSDAPDALVAVRSDEPFYALVVAELGAAAQPLEQAGPDLVLLAYVDREAGKLSLVNVPASLQVSVDNAQRRLGDVAELGDAAFIRAVQNFAKVDISHFVKVQAGGMEGIVDALGGVDVTLDQVVDDPHAGDVYLPVGTYTLNGAAALTYLRATNLQMGQEDQLRNQVGFAALLAEKIFSGEGTFAGRIESIDSYFQTDQSLADFEGLASWLSGVKAEDIATMQLPGYMTSTAGVVDLGESRFICATDDMARIVAALEGEEEALAEAEPEVEPASPSSFTVEVQNGTEIAGAAATTAEQLAGAGFNVEKTGNAEQQVYTETLVVYKANDRQGQKPSDASGEEPGYYYDEDTGIYYDANGDEIDGPPEPENVRATGGNDNGVGLSRAEAVVKALGIGRAVEAGSYYALSTDVLVIVGSDFKPVS